MIIPSNGRVVIVDDKIEQAMPLITTLSKDKIPFTYHSEDPLQLPATPYDDIRLLFLDINLTDGVNENAISAQLQSTLVRLVKPDSTYMLVVWSIRENEYEELLDNLFRDKIPRLKPLLKTSLAKNTLFTINDNTGHYEPNPEINIIAEINKRLSVELDKADSFKVLMKFENLINNCSSSIITQFSNVVAKDEYWSSNIKHIFFKMAHAQLGKNILNTNENKITHAALKTLTSTLSDRVESELYEDKLNEVLVGIKKDGMNFYKNVDGRIVRLKWEDVNTNVLYIDTIEKGRNKIVDKLKGANEVDTNTINTFKEIYRVTSPKLNTVLLFSFSNVSALHPGNVYLKTVTGLKKRKLLNTYFNGLEKKLNNIYINKDISEFWFVELECTPICDYSQKKWLRSRILSGILYPLKFQPLLNQDNDSLYKEIPAFLYLKTTYKLVFDYRLFKSINLRDDHNYPTNFLFKLKNEVLIDIQARISSHVNRPGITTIS